MQPDSFSRSQSLIQQSTSDMNQSSAQQNHSRQGIPLPSRSTTRNNNQLSIKKRKPNDNRKNGQATRTLKACELCRKQKTRCFRVNEETKSCLRCTFLNKECSFNQEPSIGGSFTPSTSSSVLSVGDKKLDMIYNGLNEILSLLKGDNTNTQSAFNPIVSSDDAKLLLAAANSMKETSNSPNFQEVPEEQREKMVTNPIDLENHTDFQTPTNSLEVSPFQIINNQVKPDLIPKSIENLLNLSTVKKSSNGNMNTPPLLNNPVPNIISLNILPLNEVNNLMTDFRRNYGRWISFPSNLPTEILVERLTTKSPLLLTTCCVLSLRFLFNNINPGDINNSMRKRMMFNSLVKQLIKELNMNLMKINCFTSHNGEIEFLQSLVILAIYSSSLTSIILSNNQALLKHNNNNLNSLNFKEFNVNLNDINFDAWYLSGVGLNIFISTTTLGNLLPKDNLITSPSITSPFTILYDEELDSNEYQTLTIMRIYNHLVLVHLMNCIFSGRMCVVDEIRLNYCNITLGLPSSTNFDGRMVLEISILLITYNFIQINVNVNNVSYEELNANLNSTMKDIRMWYEQWDYLFQQPALQFVEVCCNFCKLVIYYCYNYQKYLILNNLRNLHSTNETFNEDNVKFIMSVCSDSDKLKLFEYSNNIINFINLINNDSYFAYLSDQLQFSFYFAAIFLMKFLHVLQQENNLTLLNMSGVNDLNCLTNIKLLINKFHNINNNETNDNDIISKFKNSVKFQMKKLFPLYY